MAEVEKNYPYLGVHYINKNEEHPEQSTCYVVLFTEPDYGICVMNNTELGTVKFGELGDFSEEAFEVLPPNIPVRLSN